CLLIHLWTGGRPTLRSYEMICFYLSGWADLDEPDRAPGETGRREKTALTGREPRCRPHRRVRRRLRRAGRATPRPPRGPTTTRRPPRGRRARALQSPREQPSSRTGVGTFR